MDGPFRSGQTAVSKRFQQVWDNRISYCPTCCLQRILAIRYRKSGALSEYHSVGSLWYWQNCPAAVAVPPISNATGYIVIRRNMPAPYRDKKTHCWVYNYSNKIWCTTMDISHKAQRSEPTPKSRSSPPVYNQRAWALLGRIPAPLLYAKPGGLSSRLAQTNMFLQRCVEGTGHSNEIPLSCPRLLYIV